MDSRGNIQDSAALGYEPVYYLALCSANEADLPNTTDMMWLFSDSEESVYEHYYHEIRKNMKAGSILESFASEIDELKKQLEAIGPAAEGGAITRFFKRIFNGHG